jgi:hypothetical protein
VYLGCLVHVLDEEAVPVGPVVEDERDACVGPFQFFEELDSGHVGQELDPVHLGEAVVRDDDVVSPPAGHLQGLLRGVDGVDPDLPHPLEVCPGALEGVAVVVDEKNGDHG